MVNEKDIEEKIRERLSDDLDNTINEDKNIDADAVESYSSFRKWIESASLKDFVDEYGVDWITSNVCLDEDEEEYLEEKYGDN